MTYKLAASLMGMDLLNVGEQIKHLNTRAYMNHVDVLDWHFARNLCFSPEFIQQVKSVCTIPLDIHLMIKDMEIDIIKEVVDAGADYVSMHPEEINKNAFKYIDYIKGKDRKVGIVLNPTTPIDTIRYYIEYVDLITFMGVTPGFPGQQLVPAVLDKIKEAHRLREDRGYSYLTQIDGGCNEGTLKQIFSTGVDILIVGKTLLFGQDPHIPTAWDKCVAILDKCIYA